MKSDTSPVLVGMKQGFWFALALASVWAVSVFATAAWGALPTVNTGSGLTSTAWNDLVGHVNTLANAMNVSSGNVGVGITPTAKLDVNGDTVVRGNLTTNSDLVGVPYGSNMPNDMSFPADGSVYWSNTAPMPIGTYFYQVYGCYGQNNFSGWALGTVNFVSGAGTATLTNYFDNTNTGGGSCGYFLQGFIKVTTAGSVVRFKITNNYAGGSNVDQNPTANSFWMHAWKIY